MNVLIVDSSRLFHQIVSSQFAETGLRPIKAESGNEALRMAASQHFDFVCSSYVLPDMDGIEFCRRFRKLRTSQYVPIVLLTSEHQARISQEALMAGITEVFFRDEIHALVTFIQRLLILAEPLNAKVLLVEDNTAQQMYYRALLERANCIVESCQDAQTAIAAFEANDFDVVITDIVLAGPMSGIGIVNHIRRVPGDKGETPILALTAFDDLTRRVELFHLGVNDYIIKPAVEAELLKRLRNLIGIHVLMRDLKRREREAQGTAEKLLNAVEQVSSAVAIAGIDGRIEYANPRFANLVGCPLDSVYGQPLATFDGEPLGLPSKSVTLEHLKRRHDGATYPASETLSPILDATGHITHYLAIHDDISTQQEMRERLIYHAMHDNLTGLLNGAQLQHRVSQARQECGGDTPPHLVLFDVSHLRMVNDVYGHEAGDNLIKELGNCLASHQSAQITAARIRSGRLALIVVGMAQPDTLACANTVLADLAKRLVEWGPRKIPFIVAAGMAPIEAGLEGPQEAFRCADTACHVAREEGGGMVVLYQEDDPRIEARHGARKWLHALQQGLDENRFELHAQLITPLREGLPFGFELLLRYQDPERGLLTPALFLPAAEHYGLMPRIDRRVLDLALDWIQQQPIEIEVGLPFYAINLSGQSVCNSEFCDYALARLRACGIPPEQLHFEVTESVMVTDAPSAKAFFAAVRELGYRWSLDDFGSGFASYGQLRNLPLDVLKIDGQFIKQIAQDDISRAMVRSMADIGRLMNMHTIAEFVEDEATLAILRELDISYAQGYLLGRPAPLNRELPA